MELISGPKRFFKVLTYFGLLTGLALIIYSYLFEKAWYERSYLLFSGISMILICGGFLGIIKEEVAFSKWKEFKKSDHPILFWVFNIFYILFGIGIFLFFTWYIK